MIAHQVCAVLALAAAVSSPCCRELTAAEKVAINALGQAGAGTVSGLPGLPLRLAGAKFETGSVALARERLERICRKVKRWGAPAQRRDTLMFEASAETNQFEELRTFELNFEANTLTYVREWRGSLRGIEMQRVERLNCEFAETSDGRKAYRLTNQLRLTPAELQEAKDRLDDLSALSTGRRALSAVPAVRCAHVERKGHFTRETLGDMSPALLDLPFSTTVVTEGWGNYVAPRVSYGPKPLFRYRLPGEAWQSTPADPSPRSRAVSAFVAWLEDMDGHLATECTALSHEAEAARSNALEQARLQVQKEIEARSRWLQQVSLLKRTCTLLPGWRFTDIPELHAIKTGYVMSYGDTLHGLDMFSAVAVDVDRKLVIFVRAPQVIRLPLVWFSEDPLVQSSCQIIAPQVGTRKSAYLEIIQSAPASPELVAAARLAAERATHSPHPSGARGLHGVPPRHGFRFQGAETTVEAFTLTDPVLQQFTELLHSSEAYKKARATPYR